MSTHTLRLVHKIDQNLPTLLSSNSADAPINNRKLADLLDKSSVGAVNSVTAYAADPVAAQATLTVTGDGVNGESFSIANVTISIVTTVSGANQVAVASSASALAAEIAALVNSSSSFTGVCSASVASAVVTLTASLPGAIGNGLQVAVGTAPITLTHAFGTLVAGSEGTTTSWHEGLAS